MSWSATLVDQLRQPSGTPLWLVRTYQLDAEPYRPWACASLDRIAPGAGVTVLDVAMSGGRVTPIEWSATRGGARVRLAGDLAAWSANVQRGTVLEICIGFPGWAAGAYERVWVGVYQGTTSRDGQVWDAELVDLLSTLTQRWGAPDEYSEQLFRGVGGGTTVAVDYTPGDVALKVASTSQARLEAGGAGVVLVTPAAGDAFFLTYTGTATGPTRLTGVSAGGRLGTTAAAAVVGDAVTFGAWLDGHPATIAGKVLTSRAGSAANGALDVLPEYWGLGISSELVDVGNIAFVRQTQLQSSAGNYTWQLAVMEAAEDAAGWLSGKLAQAGVWLVMRQGLITIRAAQSTQRPLFVAPYTIRDADVIDLTYEDYDGDHAAEYSSVAVYGSVTGGAIQLDTPATMPSASGLEYVVEGAADDALDMAADDLARLAEAAMSVGEVLTLTLATPAWSVLVEGDLVELALSSSPARGGGTMDGRTAMVLAVDPMWGQWQTRVVVVVYPATSAAFG